MKRLFTLREPSRRPYKSELGNEVFFDSKPEAKKHRNEINMNRKPHDFVVVSKGPEHRNG